MLRILKLESLAIGLLLVLSLLPAVPVVAVQEDEIRSVFDPRKIEPTLARAVLQGEEVEGIAVFEDYVRGFVTVDVSALPLVSSLVDVIYVAPIVGDVARVYGTFERHSLIELASTPWVYSIAADTEVALPEFEREEETDPLVERDRLPTSYRVVQIHGSDRANDVLGVTGEGIRVAVVDTGVDYAQPNLRHALDFDEAGNPLVIDTDEQGLVYPFFSFEAVEGESAFLPTAGETFLIYNGWWVVQTSFSEGYIHPTSWMDVGVPVDIDVTGIVSLSGTYKLGFFIWYVTSYGVYFYDIPVLYADPNTAGVYDTVYFDVSSAYNELFLGLPRDWSFADENPYSKGDVVAEDYTGPFGVPDGIPDISIGVVGGYFLDASNLFGTGIMSGWSSEGEYLDVFYDYFFHGTSVASNIASDGSLGYDVFFNGSSVSLPGMAPDAKIVGVLGCCWNGFIEAGWLWAAGFDLVFIDGLPVFVYSGELRAHIINNSWGSTVHMRDLYGNGYDPTSILEDSLMIPGFLDPDFPGVLMVHSAGNDGPGFGSADGSPSSLALKVCASTSHHAAWWYGMLYGWDFFEDIESSALGHWGDVQSWSSRGFYQYGKPGPDVCAVGAWELKPSFIFDGLGDGSWSFTNTGGTSFSGPIVAGVAALVAQVQERSSSTWDPLETRRILMNTAEDLNNDATAQGTGNVNAFKAVSAALAGSEPSADQPILASTDVTYANLATQMQDAWNRMFGTAPPFGDVSDAVGYAGRIEAGQGTSFSIQVESTSDEALTVTPQAYRLQRIGDPITLQGVMPPGGVAFFDLDPADFIAVDLVRVTSYYDFELFDPEGDYSANTRVTLVAGEWADLNEDGVVDLGEVSRFNRGYNYGTTEEITIGDLYGRMIDPENNKFLLYSYNPRTPMELPFAFRIEKFSKTDWGWLSFDEETIQVGSTADLGVSLDVPADAGPGYYAGFISLVADNGEDLLMPVSVVVPLVLENGAGTIGTGEVNEEFLYDPTSVRGHFQWATNFQSNHDWRFFVVKVDNIFAQKLDATASWVDPRTNLDIYVLSPQGKYIGTTDVAGFTFGGIVLWHSTLPSATSTRAEASPYWGTMWAASQVPNPWDIAFEAPAPSGMLTDGYYTIEIKNGLYGGMAPAEPITIEIQVTPGAVSTSTSRIAFSRTTIPASPSDPFYSVGYVEDLFGMDTGLPDSLQMATEGTMAIGGPGTFVPLNTNDLTTYLLTVATGSHGTHQAYSMVFGYRLKVAYYRFFGLTFAELYFQQEAWGILHQINLG